MPIIAAYETEWQNLSKDHERIKSKISEILESYSEKNLDYFSYAVIGTFGVGKTQLLYHIHKTAQDIGLLPLYTIAEDLFREVITEENGFFTPGDLFALLKEKVTKVTETLKEKQYEKAMEILDPRGKLSADAKDLTDSILNGFSGKDIPVNNVLLLVDELEGQYGILQSKVKTMDRSPLREWLEDKSSLKFLSFAPAGIYELGGADRDRVKRIVIPPADIDYIRENLIKEPGRSNGAWWLSRGKARQLFKACDVLMEKGQVTEADVASRIIKSELDSIGQEPTQVPPAVTNVVNPSKIPFLLDLCPLEGEKAKRYVINTLSLNTGQLADKLIEAFSIDKDNAILISEYFKRTVRALSDEHGITFINGEDLQELFCLVLDHLIEYEHGSPELSGSLGEILNLYEKVKREQVAIYGTIGRLWELKETNKQLPLLIEEIRKAFPFPTMNPIVKNHLPAEIKSKLEGKGLPIWTWSENETTALFFASVRDLSEYCEKDEFVSISLPEGKKVLCLLPSGEKPDEEKPLVKWLKNNRKVEFLELPPLLTDFLLSAAGEIQDSIPADLRSNLSIFKEDKSDIILLRKTEIYSEAISEKIKSLGKPEIFDKGALPDTNTIWGKGTMERDVAIIGISLAFVDLTTHEKNLLVELRALLRSSKEGRGSGDLNPLTPRGGYISICDDLLPRYGKKKELKDSEPIGRLKAYWREEEKDQLSQLARILSNQHFIKLHPEEDMNRLLEALWKTVRKEFEPEDLETIIQKYERKICPTLETGLKIENEGKDEFGLVGINFEDMEKLVKAKDGIRKITEIGKEALKDDGSAAPLVKCITFTFMEAVLKNIEKSVNVLESLSGAAERRLEELTKESGNLRKNFWEYSKATKFVGMTEDRMKSIIADQKKIGGNPTLQVLETTAKEKKEYLESISSNLSFLEKDLQKLDSLFTEIKERK